MDTNTIFETFSIIIDKLFKDLDFKLNVEHLTLIFNQSNITLQQIESFIFKFNLQFIYYDEIIFTLILEGLLQNNKKNNSEIIIFFFSKYKKPCLCEKLILFNEIDGNYGFTILESYFDNCLQNDIDLIRGLFDGIKEYRIYKSNFMSRRSVLLQYFKKKYNFH
ncbi:hypothetical protein ABK040_013602 [Willaertia magna]